MNALEIVFWLAALCVGYTYVGYPLLLWAWARLRPAPPFRQPFAGTLTIVISARNEEATIARRLEELCRHITANGLSGEIVLVSDGSTDATAARAQPFVDAGLVRVLELPENVGKAAALTIGLSIAAQRRGRFRRRPPDLGR